MNEKKSQKRISLAVIILSILAGILLFALDRITKIYVSNNFELDFEHRKFIPGIIDLTYIHNSGGAWGIMSGQTWILIVVTAVVMAVCVAFFFKYGIYSKLLAWAVSLVLFGGVGNMYDRIFNGGKVVDFLHFTFMPSFPVFNVADCGVVIGAGLLILYFIISSIKENKEKTACGEENGNN